MKFKVVGDVDMDVDGGFLVVWLQELRKMPMLSLVYWSGCVFLLG